MPSLAPLVWRMLRFVWRRPRSCLGWPRLVRRARPCGGEKEGMGQPERQGQISKEEVSERGNPSVATERAKPGPRKPWILSMWIRRFFARWSAQSVSQLIPSLLRAGSSDSTRQIRGRRMGRRQFVHPKAYRKELFASTDRAEPRRRPMQTDLHYPVPPSREERRRCRRRERERKKRARLSLARHLSRIQKNSLLLYSMCTDDKPEKG